MTWNGGRELLFHLADPEPAVEALQGMIDQHHYRPFSFRCELDEDWKHVAIYLDAA